MSLILDALRRADSERDRDRGAVPGLHAQQVAVAPDTVAAAGAPPWLWLAIVAGTGAAAALAAWVITNREAPPPVSAAATPSAAAPPAAAPPSALPPTAAVAAAPPAPLPPTAAVAAAPPAPLPAVPRAEAAPAQPVAEPAPWTAQDARRRAPTAEVAAVPAARPAEVKSAPAETAITPREQLPANIRSQLPPLAVGGSIYSANAPDRSIIIDGRLLRENDRLAADLTLEQIRPKSAVLRFRGHRFEIGF